MQVINVVGEEVMGMNGVLFSGPVQTKNASTPPLGEVLARDLILRLVEIFADIWTQTSPYADDENPLDYAQRMLLIHELPDDDENGEG